MDKPARRFGQMSRTHLAMVTRPQWIAFTWFDVTGGYLATTPEPDPASFSHALRSFSAE